MGKGVVVKSQDNLLAVSSRALASWTLKMGLTGCLETLVTNYQSILCNMPEERRSQMHVKLKYGTLGAGGCFVGLGIDGMIILKRVLKT